MMNKEKSIYLIFIFMVVSIIMNINNNFFKYLLVIPVYADFIYMDSYTVEIDNNTIEEYTILSLPINQGNEYYIKDFYNKGEVIFSLFSIPPQTKKIVYFDKGYPMKYLILKKGSIFDINFFTLQKYTRINDILSDRIILDKNLFESISIINYEYLKFLFYTTILMTSFVLLIIRKEDFIKKNNVIKFMWLVSTILLFIFILLNLILLIFETKYIYFINFAIS